MSLSQSNKEENENENEKEKEKKTLICLHGALGSEEQFEQLRSQLQENFQGKFQVYTFNFEGHGKSPGTDRPFRIENFVENTLTFMKEKKIAKAQFFGYSMGGYVALVLATQFPERVQRITSLGTKFFWNPEAAKKEASYLNPDLMLQKVPKLAQDLEQRHGREHWKIVVQKTAQLLLDLGERDLLQEDILKGISLPVRVMMGDRDKMVALGDTQKAYHSLPQGELGILPKTQHPFETVNLDFLIPFLL